MPEPREDARQRWVYEFDGPTVDLQRDRSKVRMPNLVESVGTDGRFLGAIRPFPGFADDSVHGVEDPGISGIKLAKFCSVQKGLSNHVLRGIVFLAANTASHSLDDADEYKWESVTGDVYALTRANNSVVERNDPQINQPTAVTADGNALSFVTYVDETTVNNLSAGQWTYGTYASILPGETIFVRINGEPTNPNSRTMTYTLAADALYFSYYDTETEDSAVVTLDDFAQVKDSPLTFDDYDITCTDRYIYFVGGTPTFNRAYWWDFEFTGWQVAVGQFESRYAGVYYGDAQYDVKADTDSPARLSFAGFEDIGENRLQDGDYSVGVELVSRKHNLRSRLAVDRWQSAEGIEGSAVEWVRRLGLPYKWLNSYPSDRYWDGRWFNESTTFWGMHHWDTIRFYRSLANSNAVPSDYAVVGELYYEGSVNAADDDAVYEMVTDVDPEVPDKFGDDKWREAVPSVVRLAIGRELSDDALGQTINSYNPFLQAVGEMPPSKRIAAMDGALLVSTLPQAKADPELDWHYEGSLPEVFRYSSLTTGEAENFPTSNVYRPSEQGDPCHSLEKAGDYVFGVTVGNLYRFLRSGSQFAGVRLLYKVGGVSRWGQTGVGNTLYIVTNSGFREVDGNTGGMRSMSALDRMIFHERKWGSTLANVHVEYDSVLGCLVLLNTSTDECILLWEATGAITTLEGCPWAFLTSGPNARTGEGRRVYFVMADGRVHTIDAAREMARVTMFGITQADIDAQASPGIAFTEVNALVESGTSTTLTLDIPVAGAGPVWPNGCEGFRFYFLSGALKGQYGTIVSFVDGVATVSGLDCSSAAAGDWISIAPVVFRVTCPQLHDAPGVYDLFTRKKALTVSASITGFDDGEMNGVIPEFNVGCFKRLTKTEGGTFTGNDIQDQTATKLGTYGIAGSHLYPYIECLQSDVDFELQALLVRGSVTGTEAETRQQ